MTILIADDDRLALEGLQSTLGKWGHEVVACTDGEEAWNILSHEDNPKLAILDWMMPGLEGVEVCRKVRELDRPLQIYLLLLTVKGSEEDIVSGLEAGADDYVVKPFRPDELWARVRVGIRFIELQEKLLDVERVRVLAETSGATAHVINQPLTVIIGVADLLLMKKLDESVNIQIDSIRKAGTEISEIVAQMKSAEQYVTTPYVNGINIVEFDASKKEEGKDE